MNSFFDLNIVIPAGRKAGKYLQKIFPVNDLSALVKSLEYCAVVFESKKDYFSALDSCHSCQSGDAQAELFYRVYSQLSNIRFVGLIASGGTPVARCLINVKKCTYAPIYGRGHFMLEQRLQFAGYRPGDIATIEEIQPFLDTVEKPVCSPDTFPKSTIKTKLNMYCMPEKPRYPVRISKNILAEKINAAEEFCFEVPEKAYFSAIKKNKGRMVRKYSPENIDIKIFQAIDMWRGYVGEEIAALATYKREKRKYDKAYKKYAPEVKHGQVFYKNIEYLAPVKETYFLRETESTEWFATTFYLDSEKSFLNRSITVPAGWYKKP
jgi:hypothetical protein